VICDVRSKKEKANHVSMTGLYLCRQRSEFVLSGAEGIPRTFVCSAVDPAGYFGVRANTGASFRDLTHKYGNMGQ